MPKNSGDAAPSKKMLQESDSPIVEEYMEDLLNGPGYRFSLPDMTTRVCRRSRVS